MLTTTTTTNTTTRTPLTSTIKSSMRRHAGPHVTMATDPHVTMTTPDEKLLDEITIVTAYMNIGKFQKGEGSTHFTPGLYHRWVHIFSRIQNPAIAYFERSEDIEYFKKLRNDLPINLTMIVKVSRDHLWAFGLRERIAKIYAQPNYPKHHPNTVIPNYSCVMHAKYEFMQNTTRSNPFKTRYFAWLDIGLFRDIAAKGEQIKLHLPASFDHTRVAYTEVFHRNVNESAGDIFRQNLVWLCRCYFIAERSVMQRWSAEYMQATELFLSHNLMNTDQQVLYAMFNNRNTTDIIQTYKGTGKYNAWFHLGFLCTEQNVKKTQGGTTTT